MTTAAEVRRLAGEVVEAWERYSAVRTSDIKQDPTIAVRVRKAYVQKIKALGAALDEPDAGLSVHSAQVLIRILDESLGVR